MIFWHDLIFSYFNSLPSQNHYALQESHLLVNELVERVKILEQQNLEQQASLQILREEIIKQNILLNNKNTIENQNEIIN